MNANPGIRVDWTAYAGSGFVDYPVYRRELRSVLDEQETLTMQITGDFDRMQMPSVDIINGIQWAIAERVTFPWDNSTEPGGGSSYAVFFDYQEDSSHYCRGRYDEANNRLQLIRETTAGVSTLNVNRAITLNETVTLVWAADADTLYLSINGAPFETVASVAGIELDIDAVDIGTQLGLFPAEVITHWVALFADIPTEDDLAILAALSDDVRAPGELSDLVDAVPTAVWHSDELTGAKVVIDEWTQIAAVDVETMPYFVDYGVASGRDYEYAVTVRASIFGDLMESDKQYPYPIGSVEWGGVAIHDVRDPNRYVICRSREWTVDPQLDAAEVFASGRTLPTMQYGEADSARMALTPIIHTLADRYEWTALRSLFGRQASAGAIYWVRPGHVPERYTAQLAGVMRTDDLTTWQSAIPFVEAHFDESVA